MTITKKGGLLDRLLPDMKATAVNLASYKVHTLLYGVKKGGIDRLVVQDAAPLPGEVAK